ncbi:winged helix DNA-binding domain-containing protein [Streptomyces sp. NPDC050418]|uniref:winged helix DNA-binding domain-containing protein n=1 Tax=Streptomyces sp. NPDC050418 TaxID=3365612 RepID=UPI0037A3B5A2
MPGGAVLDNRALGRASLARQLLLRRHGLGVEEAVEHLVGLQAQLANPPYVGLWSRLSGFALADLTELLTARDVVRGGLMRGTLHVATARDFRRLRPVLQPVFDKAQRGFFRRDTEGMDLGELTAFGASVLDARHSTNGELRAALAERWPERDATALLHSVQYLLPMLYVPPGGTWGAGGATPMATVESWLGGPLPEADGPAELILRYLAAFGPATVKDIQAWSGLTRLKQPVDELRPKLVTYRSAESGAELFDLPDAPRPDPDTPAPVRFLPEYDNLLVAYADRTRIISDEHRAITNTRNGSVAATVLVDGRVAGRWRIDRAAKTGPAALEAEMFVPLSPADREQVEAEGERLLAFIGEGGAVRVV